MSKVSIITVNFRQAEHTADLLKSLTLSTHQELEVIVVDAGRKEDQDALFEASYPGVKIIHSKENLGFAGANNLGIRAASGEYLFFVNNDTIIPKHTISSLVEDLENDESVGMICPRIYYNDQPEMIQYAGYTPLNWVTARNEAVLYHQKEDLENRVEKTAFGHGAAMMLPRHVIDQLGEMPEVYFLYYEELEWGHRLKQLGYQIAVDHSTYILHKESVSVGKGSPLKTYFITRNRMLFMRRNAGAKWWLFMFYFALVVLPAHVLRYAIKRDWAQLKSLVAGVQWNCTNTTTSDRLGYIYGNLKFS